MRILHENMFGIIIFIGIIILCYLHLCRWLKSFFLRRTEDLGIDYGEEFQKRLQIGQKWMQQHPFQEVGITSHDGLKLKAGWWDFESELTVLYIHGYGNTFEQSTLFSELFVDKLQANVLAPDSRAHGRSEGDFIGFGWQDRKDVLDWIQYVLNKKGLTHQIILYGVSMGGATVLSLSGEKLPSNVQFICSDCGYSNLKEVFEYQIKNNWKLPVKMVMNIVSYKFKKWYGFSINEISPSSQVKKSSTPILFIHGEKDHFIPVNMAVNMYENCSEKKDLLIIPLAKHGLCGIVDWEQYCEFIIKNYEKWRK